MDHKENLLTATEWHLMECLWEKSPRTGREATEDLEQRAGWSRSTTLTMLRRMTEKGLIDCREEGGVKVYRPLLPREDAALRTTEDFLHRVYHGSIGLMLSAFTKKQALSQKEIDELYAILDEAKKGANNG
jgi:BlaI family penicillinase repressor